MRFGRSNPVSIATGMGWLAIPLLLLVGCATTKTSPPTEEVRARLGTVAVQSAKFTTQTELVKPFTPGQAAAAGALVAVAEMTSGRELGLLLMPIGALVGGVRGSAQGTPKNEKRHGDDQRIASLALGPAIPRHFPSNQPLFPALRSRHRLMQRLSPPNSWQAFDPRTFHVTCPGISG